MAQGLARFWNEWGIQVLVLFSFTLQVMLLAFAETRRRKSSAPLRLLLWLMYQLADSTAIYTLGHLSVASSKAQDQHLVAFWAPFLLVHLGGPGTITAYALEDNRLWLRHLLTLSVQILGAAFVIYKYIVRRRTLLLLAAILVFVVGVLRYGERTWALCHWKKLRWPNPRQDDQDKSFGDEELLLGAHSLFHVCKIRFVDATERMSEFDQTCTRWYGGKDLSGLLEMELSLMYDILYTKAAVVHTWYGYTILVVSPLATSAALLLFHYSSDKHGKSKVNVGITYTLLSGTLALETISVARAIGSTWACALMYCCGWERLLGAVTYLRRRIGAASKRRWSGSMGQYNLLHLCTRDRTELGGRLAAKLGLRSWWNKVHYSGTIAISTTYLKDRMLPVFSYVHPKARGIHALNGMGIFKNSAQYIHSTLSDFAFDDSILFWHIATDVYLSESKVEHEEKLVAAVQVLSNYMMFLMIAQPEMLTAPIQQGQYVDTFNDLDRMWDRHCSANQNQGPLVEKWWSMLKKLFQSDKPNASRMRQRKELATKFLTVDADTIHEEGYNGPAFFHGRGIASWLLATDSDSTLEVIFRVWLEMLCYAAHHCSRDSHARQLNNGGEFLTVVWLLSHWQNRA
uniref:DUF4220 domain-containing protein n=2 Tax=Setaria viridis TaxID=4556 RepID=A0A4U6U3D5_SETVI|nr:hypothetical protein SEVIR_6G048400v2 [Setaria viridis]